MTSARKPILLEPEKVIEIIMSFVLLHNFLRSKSSSSVNRAPEIYYSKNNDGIIIPGSEV